MRCTSRVTCAGSVRLKCTWARSRTPSPFADTVASSLVSPPYFLGPSDTLRFWSRAGCVSILKTVDATTAPPATSCTL